MSYFVAFSPHFQGIIFPVFTVQMIQFLWAGLVLCNFLSISSVQAEDVWSLKRTASDDQSRWMASSVFPLVINLLIIIGRLKDYLSSLSHPFWKELNDSLCWVLLNCGPAWPILGTWRCSMGHRGAFSVIGWTVESWSLAFSWTILVAVFSSTAMEEKRIVCVFLCLHCVLLLSCATLTRWALDLKGSEVFYIE